MAERKQIKIIWGMAKNLNMSKEDVYALLYQQSWEGAHDRMHGAGIIPHCTGHDLLKERRTNRPGMISGRQRYRIGELERQLGWKENPNRLKAFIKNITM